MRPTRDRPAPPLPIALFATTALALATSCASSAKQDPGESPLVRAEDPLEQLRSRQLEAFAQGDLTLFLDGMADDAVLMLPDQPALVGRSAIAARLQPLFDLFRLDASALSVDGVCADDWGYDRGTLDVRARPVTGGKRRTRTTRYLLVARKSEHDGWRITQLAFNSPARRSESPAKSVAAVPAGEEAARESSEAPEVHAALASLRAADNAGDARAVAGHYTEDAMLLPPGHSFLKGRSAIRAHYEQTFERFQFVVDIRSEATWAGARWATSRGITRGSNVERKNGKIHPFEHHYLMILRREEEPRDGPPWKVHRILWSSRGIR